MVINMQRWQLQEAKAHLSEVVRKCLKDGPQLLTVGGKEEVVMISLEDYELLIGLKPNLVEFMQLSPLRGSDLKIDRDKSSIRDVDL